MGPPDLSLVGRAEELAIAQEAMAGAGPRGLVVAGSAGVGKSRLASELLAHLSAGGARTRWAVATASSSHVPLGALAPWLGSAPVNAGARLGLLRAVEHELTTPADRASIIGVDDAHHLDDLSATAILQVAVTGAVGVIVTIRSGERVPDAVQALWKDGHLTRLDLQPLSRAEVDQLVSGALGGPVITPTANLVWQLSRGNPLFVRELVANGLGSGRLAEVDGFWHWTGELAVTGRLHELIEHRIGSLDEATRAATALLAFGEPLGLDVLDDLGIATQISELEARHLVTVEREGDRTEVRLAHPLYGEVLRATTPAFEARDARERLATALERQDAARPSDILRAVSWRLESGSAMDPQQLVRAADIANSLFDHARAERLARKALALGPLPGATLALAESLVARSGFRESEALLAPLSGVDLGDGERVRIARVRQRALSWGLGDLDGASSMLLEIDAQVTGPYWRGFPRAELAAMLAMAGEVRDAVAVGEPLLDPTFPAATRLRVLSALGLAWSLQGTPLRAATTAMASADEVLGLRDELPQALGWVGSAVMLGRIYAGDLDGAEAIIDLSETMLSPGHRDAWERLLLYRGGVELLRGRPRTAARWLGESAVLLDADDPEGRFGLAATRVTHALALSGRVDDASRWLRAADETRALRPLWFDTDRDVAAAWLAAANHDLAGAVSRCERAAARAQELGHHTVEAFARHDAIRLGSTTDHARRLAELAASSDSLWLEAFALHAEALDADDGHLLDAAADAFESIGARLHAAEAAASAAGAHRKGALPARATASSNRALALHERCEGARTPGVAQVESPTRLSRRESEICHLAASGVSNRAIAERMGVSIRTIEGHLYRSFTKLGITRREELARVLGIRVTDRVPGSATPL